MGNKRKRRIKNQKHPHIFITGLVYPAFLGAFLYEVVYKLSKLKVAQVIQQVPQILLIAALIFVFSNDYLYTTDERREDIYNKRRALVDSVLVLLLYLSLRTALATEIQLVYIWFLMFLFKLFSFIWELLGSSDPQKKLAKKSYSIFGFLYLLGFIFSFVNCLCFKFIIWLLIIVVTVDGLTYLFWDRLSTKFGEK